MLLCFSLAIRYDRPDRGSVKPQKTILAARNANDYGAGIFIIELSDLYDIGIPSIREKRKLQCT